MEGPLGGVAGVSGCGVAGWNSSTTLTEQLDQGVRHAEEPSTSRVRTLAGWGIYQDEGQSSWACVVPPWPGFREKFWASGVWRAVCSDSAGGVRECGQRLKFHSVPGRRQIRSNAQAGSGAVGQDPPGQAAAPDSRQHSASQVRFTGQHFRQRAGRKQIRRDLMSATTSLRPPPSEVNALPRYLTCNHAGPAPTHVPCLAINGSGRQWPEQLSRNG